MSVPNLRIFKSGPVSTAKTEIVLFLELSVFGQELFLMGWLFSCQMSKRPKRNNTFEMTEIRLKNLLW